MKMIVKFKNVMWFRKTFKCDKKQCWKQEKVARAECVNYLVGKDLLGAHTEELRSYCWSY